MQTKFICRYSLGSGWTIVVLLLSGFIFPVHAQPYGLTGRQPIGTFLNGALPPREQSFGWQVVEAFPNITFNNPIGLVPEPGTNRLYVYEQNGLIYFFENNPSTSTKTLFLDLSAVTQGHEDSGVLGLAFHPEYGQPGSTNRNYVYVYYSYSPSPTQNPSPATRSYNRLSRFTVPDGSLVADPNSQMILINQYDEDWWHNGGDMFFGADGFLYLSVGDEGAANDAYNNSQKINSGLFAGVLRIDVDMNPTRSHPIRRQPQNGGTLPNGNGWINSFSTNYYIPNDNPWLNPNGSILEEFYVIGLRSPHRMTYDHVTGRIWSGDIGQSTMEEVNLIEKGGNYQWAYREGTVAGPKSKPNPLIGVDKPPVHAYGRSEGNCVIGGYVYRGTEFAAELTGKYIFGDNGSGKIWALDYDAGTLVQLASIPVNGNIYEGMSGFGQDHNKELYVMSVGANRKIMKLARVAQGSIPPPALLSQVGAFTNLTTLAARPGLIPYDVNAPLWSDGALKYRWISLPNDGAPYANNEKIGFGANGNWSFPVGTVFIKHFELPLNETNAAIRKRLETRFLTLGTNGSWYGLTYKWRDDQSDADLLPSFLNETNVITTADGLLRTQVWYYPSRSDCTTCHNVNAGSVLGVRTCQMNGDFNYPTGITDNQLRTWNHLQMFRTNLSEAIIPNYPRSVNLTNSAESLEVRVRSYLDSNCAHCHRPDGVRASFDARFDTPLAAQNIVDGPVFNPLEIAGAREVAPSSPAQSIMHVRMNSLETIKMPPLAKNRVDDAAVALLTQWINSLPPVTPPPPPWSHQDVGAVGVAGDATYNAGTFAVKASGVDIYDTADSFHFVYQPLVGNGTITARVLSMENTDPWALAGVMIRETTNANSRHAFVGCTPGHGISFSRRSSTGGTTAYTAGPQSPAPYWARLVRNGNTFTAFASDNGVTWTQVGSQTISMSTAVFVGLAYTSHNNTLLGSSSFDNVQLIGPNVNNPPTISAIPTQAIDEDQIAGPIAFTIGDSETAVTNLTLAATTSAPDLVGEENILFDGSGSNRTVMVFPATNAFGSAIIGVTVSDGTNSATSQFTLNVLPVNDVPVAWPDSLTRWMSQGVSVPVTNLLTNDADVESDLLTVTSIATSSASGASIVTSNNWLFYAPIFGNTNADSFSYVISDGQGGSSTGLVTVVVLPEPAWDDLLNIASTPTNGLAIQLSGLPGFTYTVQSADSLQSPNWQNLAVRTADENGVIAVADPNPGGVNVRFYRAVRGVVPSE